MGNFQRVKGRAKGNEIKREGRKQIARDPISILENLTIIEFYQIETAINYKMHQYYTRKKKTLHLGLNISLIEQNTLAQSYITRGYTLSIRLKK